MSEPGEIESELRKLRPIAASPELFDRIERALLHPDETSSNVIARRSLGINWLGLGLGLAVAATFLVLAWIDFRPASKNSVVSSPATSPRTAAELPDYRAAGLTQIVYSRRDEGLFFPPGAQQPVRRLRTAKRETLRWRDVRTGAQLRVSYPTEEITFTPVSGQ